MKEAFLLLGGNIGDRKFYLEKALEEIEGRCGRIVRISSIYETEAWGDEEQESFLNQVVLIETEFSPQELLKTILKIEAGLGRIRTEKNAARTIDIDILFYGDEVIKDADLEVPHTRMQLRKFVLLPLSEIAPEKIHPVLQDNIQTILQNCPDKLTVNKIS